MIAKYASPRKEIAASPNASDDGFVTINVGGKNMLPMARLKAIFVEAGCVDVRTYIQSGNIQASQFHPDMSGSVGLAIVKAFADQ